MKSLAIMVLSIITAIPAACQCDPDITTCKDTYCIHVKFDCFLNENSRLKQQTDLLANEISRLQQEAQSLESENNRLKQEAASWRIDWQISKPYDSRQALSSCQARAREAISKRGGAIDYYDSTHALGRIGNNPVAILCVISIQPELVLKAGIQVPGAIIVSGPNTQSNHDLAASLLPDVFPQ